LPSNRHRRLLNAATGARLLARTRHHDFSDRLLGLRAVLGAVIHQVGDKEFQ
jgi:hypothetical protein